MSTPTSSSIEARVARAAAAALDAQEYVSPIDVLLHLGWLAQARLDEWRHGRLPFLEAGIQVSPSKLAHAMRLLREWAAAAALTPSDADYVSRSVARTPLRFSESGDAELERSYRTHWLSPTLSDRKRKKIEAKASAPPELVAIDARKKWSCHRCGGTGGFFVMETPGPACLTCLGFGDLVWLPSGDAQVTRKARAASARTLVVVRWSPSNKRYQRIGALVEPRALAEARGADRA